MTCQMCQTGKVLRNAFYTVLWFTKIMQEKKMQTYIKFKTPLIFENYLNITYEQHCKKTKSACIELLKTLVVHVWLGIAMMNHTCMML